MKIIGILITFAGVILGVCLPVTTSFAQSSCKGVLFGIPVCTGFCLEIDSTSEDKSSQDKWIEDLEASMDSLSKQAQRMQDSLVTTLKRARIDSLLGKLPKEMQKWKFEFPPLQS